MPMPKGVKALRPRGDRRSKTIKLNLTPTEHAHVARLAAAAGQSASAWLYDLVAPLLLPVHLPPAADQDPLPFTEQTERT